MDQKFQKVVSVNISLFSVDLEKELFLTELNTELAKGYVITEVIQSVSQSSQNSAGCVNLTFILNPDKKGLPISTISGMMNR